MTSALQLVEPGARHLHRLGARATAEFLIEMAEPVGELAFLLRRLAAYREVSPEQLSAVGGERFPRRLFAVGGGYVR